MTHPDEFDEPDEPDEPMTWRERVALLIVASRLVLAMVASTLRKAKPERERDE